MSIAVPLYGFGTGGGDRLKLRIFSGTSAPSNPKDNDIWVKTSVAISPWEFSEVANPTWAMSNGFVYFTSTYTDAYAARTTVGLNFIKKDNTIYTKLLRCTQYVDGTWYSKDAYIYHDGWHQFSATRNTPEFTYTGTCKIVDDSGNEISDFAAWTGNWKIRFLTSGTLTFTNLNGWDGKLDVFLVGGGGAGGNGVWSNGYVQANTRGGGAGAGYTTTKAGVSVSVNTSYTISIGAGAAAPFTDPKENGLAGGATSAFSVTAKGGGAPSGGAGGNGGSGGGNTNYEGATNGSGGTNAGTGQGTTTREFGESSGKLYATGGSGVSKKNGTANTGDGGSGGKYADTSGGTVASGGSGGSGIVIIRNKR